MLKPDLKEAWYDFLDLMIIVGGMLGNVMVWFSLAAGCILLWYFVFTFIFNG